MPSGVLNRLGGPLLHLDVAGDDTLRLDITDREAVERFVREHAIGAVVNCAALYGRGACRGGCGAPSC